MLHRLVIAFILAPIIACADPVPNEIATSLERPTLLGVADVELLGFDLYDAALWTNGGEFSFAQPFALSLTYSRSFSADQLARQTIKEVARIENSDPEALSHLSELKTCFADVGQGDRITAVNLAPDTIRFFVNGNRSCDFRALDISRQFFSIWLGDKTRDPRGKNQLLGAG